jgi:hypothetical protein
MQGSTNCPSRPLFAVALPAVSAAPAIGAPDPSTTVPRTSAVPIPQGAAAHAGASDSKAPISHIAGPELLRCVRMLDHPMPGKCLPV